MACRTALKAAARKGRAFDSRRLLQLYFWRKTCYTNSMPMPTKELQRKYQREWRAKRRRQWVKENGPCQMCGSRKDLEVDHVDPSSKLDHNVWSWAKKRRDRELSKCQVLCGRCHKRKTDEQRPRSPHGTHNRYVSGCRCRPCLLAHNVSTRKWRYRSGLRIPGGKSWRRRG